MGVTLSDIAKVVGVSTSTVSRVINGTAPISDEIKQRTYKVMNEMDYHPNSFARNLATGSSSTIGLVLDADNESAFSNSFFNRSIYAIERVLQKNGYNLLITNHNGKKNSSICDMIYGKRVDGVIIPSIVLSPSFLHTLEEQKTPWVMLGESSYPSANICWIDLDNYEGSKKAVRHLLKMGYKKIAFIADNAEASFTTRRLTGFKNAMAENNLSISGEQILFCDNNFEKIEDMVKQNAEKSHGIDAYLCSNNILSYHTLQALKKSNRRVPEEVGVITFDNYPIAEYMTPPLTVIDADTYRLGETAAQLLIKTIKERCQPNAINLIPTNLIIRESTVKSIKN